MTGGPVPGVSSGTARHIKSGVERFRLGDRPDVTVLYPDVCFASLDAVADMPAALLVESVLDGWRPEDHLTAPAGDDDVPPFPVASLVVSRDSASAFHPELSNREPVELQVWADGRVTIEIEFQGVEPGRGSATWSDTVWQVLDSWAQAFDVRLLRVFNDRARSLPDVWNAEFETDDRHAVVADLVELGERALRTAELSMSGWGGEAAVRRVLDDGDVHALLAWPPSATLEFWSAPPEPDEIDLFAADVCALANTVRGGSVVVGVRQRPGAAAAVLTAFPSRGVERELRSIVEWRIHPVPERLEVVFVPAHPPASDAVTESLPEEPHGVVVVRIPPQDALLRPFLLHAREVVDGNVVQSVALVERDGAETVSRSVSAVHAALSAGMALLRR